MVERLPTCMTPWVPFLAPNKLGMVAHTCDLSTREEAEGSGVQGYPWLHNKFQDLLGSMNKTDSRGKE